MRKNEQIQIWVEFVFSGEWFHKALTSFKIKPTAELFDKFYPQFEAENQMN